MSNPKSGIDPTGFHINENGEFQKTPFHPSPANSFIVLLEDPTNSNIKVHALLSDITPNAVHVDIDSEFGVMPEKLSVSVTDWFILEDASGVKHKAHLVDGAPDAFHKSVPNELAEPTIPYKSIPASIDRVMIESQADGGEKQYTETAGIDTDSLHKSDTNGFDDIPIKATPTLNDWFVIQDSVTGDVYRVNLVGDGLDNFHKSLSNEFAGPEVPYKDVLASDDRILLESQVDGGAKRFTNSDGVDTTALHSTIENEIHALPFITSSNLTPEDVFVIERSAYNWEKASTSLSEIIINAGSASGENLDPTKFGLYLTTDDQVLKFKSFDSIEDATYQALNIVENEDWFNIRLDSSKINIDQIVETSGRNFVTEAEITQWDANTSDINDLEQWRIEAQGEIDQNITDITNAESDIIANTSDITNLKENAVQRLHTEGDPGSQFIVSKTGSLMTQRRISSANDILGLSVSINNSLLFTIDQTNIVGLGIQQSDLDMGGKYIKNIVLDPVPVATDVATIGYVDSKTFSSHDPNAIHVNLAQELIHIPEKVSPLEDADVFMIESSTSALFDKNKVTWLTIKDSLGQLTDIDAIHINGVNDFATIPTDNSPASTHKILAEDLGGNKKKILFSTFDVPANDPKAIHVDQPNEIFGITTTGGELGLSDILVCEKIIVAQGDHEKRSTTVNEIVNLAVNNGLRDNDAIHFNGIDEFLNISEKLSLDADDMFIFEDSTSDPVNSKSKVRISNFKIDNSDSTAFHSNVNNEWIGTYSLPQKTTVAGTDLVLLQDSENSYGNSYALVSDLPSTSGGPGTDTTAFHFSVLNEFDNIPGYANSDGEDYVLLENNRSGDPNEGEKFKQTITQLFFNHGGGGGEVNHGKNVGYDGPDSYAEVFDSMDGPTLQFRRLTSQYDYTKVSNYGDHIRIDLVPSKAGPAVEQYINADKLIYHGGITNPGAARKLSYFNYLELQACIAVCGVSSGLFGVTVGELQDQIAILDTDVAALDVDVATLDTTVAGHTDQIEGLELQSHEQGTDTTLGLLSENILMNGHKITLLGDPVNAQDAATKSWVESQVTDIDIKNYGDDVTEFSLYNGKVGDTYWFRYLKSASAILTVVKTGNSEGLELNIDPTQIQQLGQQLFSLDMGTYSIRNMGMETSPLDTDVANVGWVKNHVSSINIVDAGTGVSLYAGEVNNEYKFKTIEVPTEAENPFVLVDNAANGLTMGVDMEKITKLGAMSRDIQMGNYSIIQTWSDPTGLFKTVDMDSSILVPFKTLNSDEQWYDWINRSARNELDMNNKTIKNLYLPDNFEFTVDDFLFNRPIGYRMYYENSFYDLSLSRAGNVLNMFGFKIQNLGLAVDNGDALSLQGLLDRVVPIEPDDPDPRWKNMAKKAGKTIAISGIVEGAVYGILCIAVLLLDDGGYRYLTDEELEGGQEADGWELRVDTDALTRIGIQDQALNMGVNPINNVSVVASPLDNDVPNVKWVRDHTTANIYVDECQIHYDSTLDWDNASQLLITSITTSNITLDNIYSKLNDYITVDSTFLMTTGNAVSIIDAPTDQYDATNKLYVDNAVSALENRIKELEEKLSATG